MKIIDLYEHFNDLEKKDKEKLKLEEIFVDISGTKIPLSKLFISQEEKGKLTTRKVKSVDDFMKHIFKGEVCSDKDGKHKLSDDAYATLYYEFVSPKQSTYDSISINPKGEEIPYGLKRTLKVKEASDGDEPYLYVKIGGKWELLKEEEILFVDEGVIKSVKDATSIDQIENNDFFTERGEKISEVYVGKEYSFDSVIAKETVDLVNNQKTSYYITSKDDNVSDKKTRIVNVDGVDLQIVEEPVKYEQFISDQEYVETEVPKPNSSKTMKIHQRKVVNYQAHNAGDYVAVTIDGQIKMVKTTNLYDDDGNKIDDLSKMVGKKITVKEGDKIVATTDYLTFEQANRRYDTVKTYQLLESNPTDSSSLRLSNGQYVNEMKSAEPISFKVVDDSAKDYDKILVERIVGAERKFVIVDKNFFSKGGVPGYDLTRAKKLRRCAYKDCDVIQSKSQRLNEKDKKSAVEDCKIVGNVSFGTETLPKSDRNLELEAFKEQYKKGDYYLEEVVVDGAVRKIETPGKRYQLSDTVYMHDKAANSVAYRALETHEMTFKDGKIKNSPKYNVGNGIFSSYMKVGAAFGVSLAGAVVSGIFLPAVFPVFLAATNLSIAAGIAIPPVNIAIGIIKNGTFGRLKRVFGKYKDKTETNRKKDSKDIEKDLKELFEKKDTLTKEQIDDFYRSRVMSKVISLSQTTSNNALKMAGGKADVTSSNVNLAIDLAEDYRVASRQNKRAEKKLKKASKKFNKQQAKVSELELLGKRPSLLRRFLYERAKGKFAECQEIYKQTNETYTRLSNATFGEDYEIHGDRNKLIEKAVGLKVFIDITKFKDAELIEGLSEDEIKKLSYDLDKGLLIEGKKVFDKDKNIEKNSEEWKNLRLKILKVVNKVEGANLTEKEEVPVEIPINPEEMLEKLSKELEKLNEAIAETEKELNTHLETSDKLKEKLESLEKELIDSSLKTEEEKKNITKELNLIKKLLESLEKQKGELEVKLNELKTLKTEKELQLKEIQKEIDKLKGIVPPLEEDKEKLKEAEEELEGAEKEKEEKEAEEAELIAEKDAEIEKLKAQIRECEEETEVAVRKALEFQNTAYERKLALDKANKEKADLEAKKQELENQLKELKTEKGAEVERLKAEIERCNEEIEVAVRQALEFQNTAYERKLALDKANKEKEELEAKKQELENQLKQAQEEKIDIIAKYEKEILHLNARILVYKTLANSYKSMLDKAKLKIDSLEEENATLTAENQALSEYKIKYEALSDEIEEAEAEINQLKSELNASKSANSELLEKLRKSVEALETLLKEREEYQNKINSLETKIDLLEKENERISQENEKNKLAVQEKERFAKGLRAEIERIDAKIQDVEQKISQLDKKIEDKEKEYKSLIQRISDNEDAKTLNASISSYNKELKETQNEINTLRAMLLSAEERVKEIQNDYGDLKDEGLTKKDNEERIQKIKQLLVKSAIQLKKLDPLALKKVKEADNNATRNGNKKYDPKINSEDNLKYMLIDRDQGLMSYLQEQGIVPTDKDIEEVVDRIDQKHKAGKNATGYSSGLVNRILYEGQAYITQVYSKGFNSNP